MYIQVDIKLDKNEWLVKRFKELLFNGNKYLVERQRIIM